MHNALFTFWVCVISGDKRVTHDGFHEKILHIL